MVRSMRALAAGLLWVSVCGGPCKAAAPAPAGAAKGNAVVVLDTSGFWRMHHTFAMPVIREDEGPKPIPPAGAEIDGWKKIVEKGTALPPAGWTATEFDDGAWYRGTGGGACRTPYLSRLCLRGLFTVTDPQAVKGLSLAVDFYGGAVVYVNGRELARQKVKAGAAGADALADDYPLEAFVQEDGNLITLRGNEALLRKDVAPSTLQRIEKRTRTLEVPIPANLLRKGVNVVAVELFRAPYHKVLDAHKVVQTYKSKALTHDMSWNTCELRRVQLTAAGAAGVASGATRPQGVQVWNSDPLATDFDMDFGNPAEPLRPIRLVGARNGVYSGKVVVGSTSPIKGLKAAVGDLAGPGGGKIAAAQVRLRYATPWDVCRTTNEGCVDTTAYPALANPLYALCESPPAEVPVAVKNPGAKPSASSSAAVVKYNIERFFLDTPNQPAFVNGAVAPVWVTVKVPKDAKPGLYKGQVAIEADGKKVADVPVEVKVADWTVPDPADYATWVDLVQSPDTLALEYGVPLWSDRHFEMIARSMKYLGEAGGRILYVPLIAHTNLGNLETMVRWVKRGEDKYEYDFTIMDKYLDAAEKGGVRPKVVVLNIWDLYTFGKGGKAVRFVDAEAGGVARTGGGEKGPLVTVVDPATNKVENVYLPTYSDPASKALWKPLFAALRERLRKRGLEGAMMIGMISDDWCSKDQVEFFQEVAGPLPWVSASHGRHDAEKSLYGVGGVGYQAHAFNVNVAYVGSLRGWNLPRANTLYERWGGFPLTMPTRWRAFPEYAVTGNTRGVGRVGADTWRAVKDKSGVRKGFAWERFPEASWHQLSLVSAVMAPGPDAAVATQRFEALREGVQDAEARIQVERALFDKASADKLGPDLVKRCQQVLEERHRAMWISVATLQVGPAADHAFAAWRGCYYAGVNGYRWFQGSSWQEREERFYNLAGDVAKKLSR